MIDNGVCYWFKCFGGVVRVVGVKYIFMCFYCLQINGKVERFIQFSLCEWVYVKFYVLLQDRVQVIYVWIDVYNILRFYVGIGGIIFW